MEEPGELREAQTRMKSILIRSTTWQNRCLKCKDVLVVYTHTLENGSALYDFGMIETQCPECGNETSLRLSEELPRVALAKNL